MTDSTQQMTEALKRLEIYCRENNLTVNIFKTKMMKIRKGGHTGRKDIVLYKGQPLEYVNWFEYLGVTISAFMEDNVHNSKLHRQGITSVNIREGKFSENIIFVGVATAECCCFSFMLVWIVDSIQFN